MSGGLIARLVCSAVAAATLAGCELLLGPHGKGPSCSDPGEPLPLVWDNPSVFAVGIDAAVTVCLEDVDTRFHDIHYSVVSSDGGVATGAPAEDDGCIIVPIRTSEVTDATIEVIVAVDQDRLGVCDTYYYEAGIDVHVRVREPDAVLRFEPSFSKCEAQGPYPLLAGSSVTFDYALGAGGETLSYGSAQPPLLMDVGELMPRNGYFDVPAKPTTFTMTSMLGDGFARDVIVYEPAGIDGIAFAANDSIHKKSFTVLRPLATIGDVVGCNQPRDEQVQLTIETPTLCTFSSGEILGASTTLGFDGVVFVEGLDIPGACQLRADYGGVSETFTITVED